MLVIKAKVNTFLRMEWVWLLIIYTNREKNSLKTRQVISIDF